MIAVSKNMAIRETETVNDSAQTPFEVGGKGQGKVINMAEKTKNAFSNSASLNATKSVTVAASPPSFPAAPGPATGSSKNAFSSATKDECEPVAAFSFSTASAAPVTSSPVTSKASPPSFGNFSFSTSSVSTGPTPKGAVSKPSIQPEDGKPAKREDDVGASNTEQIDRKSVV